jgi:2-dehydro-3-deoxyphosphogalactonate aldolase
MDAHARWTTAMAQLPLVAILRGIAPAETEDVGTALYEAGWRLLEVPLNSPQPLRSIEMLARRFPDAVVGAGTVRTADEVRAVHAAGGWLVVSPHFDARVVHAAVAQGMLCLPGVATPSEAFAALEAGATALKLFPAEMIAPAVVKALRAVLPPDVRLLPVGGITPINMAAYRAAGADGFGIGSALYRPGAGIAQVRAAARNFADAWTGIVRA